MIEQAAGPPNDYIKDLSYASTQVWRNVVHVAQSAFSLSPYLWGMFVMIVDYDV